MSNGFPEWWKHGQKVRTRRDGILTLNVAPDAEYWLTNDEGKEVYVFSADIIGPVKTDAEGGRPMSNIDKQALRNLAVAAKLAPSWYAVGEFGDVVDPAKPEWKPVHEFCKTFTAARVLALLDELEAKDKLIAELTDSLKQTVSGYKSCLRTGHERILDLGGDCDSPEVMIAGSTDIQQAEKLLAAAAGKGEAS
ncbi:MULTISPECIES: ead/Ea22-like family protein [Enterobacter cloacae complex]|uniref:ead/Ea22-like family protein n=1 Tax=Enterobacter cloacae complex TaxID=354276 RepID=UPI0031D64EE4